MADNRDKRNSINSDGLVFDEQKHIYYYKDKTYPSVTTLLKKYGIIDDKWYNEEGLLRGSWIHTFLEAVDKDPLYVPEDPELWEEYAEYINAYLDFKKVMGFKPVYIEEKMISSRGYAGTPDRIGFIGEKAILIDIKTGQKSKWHHLQVAAYVIMAEERIQEKLEGMILYIKDNGRWRIDEVDMGRARRLWALVLELKEFIGE